jgi:hypothetical protein
VKLLVGIFVRWPRVLDVGLHFDRELLDRSSIFVLTAPYNAREAA